MLKNRIVLGDNVAGMRGLPDGCIHLTVTSPPYDDLRTYGGHSRWDFAGVARELYRITVPGGVVVWVVQEQIVNGSETGESSRQRLAFPYAGERVVGVRGIPHNAFVRGARGIAVVLVVPCGSGCSGPWWSLIGGISPDRPPRRTYTVPAFRAAPHLLGRVDELLLRLGDP